MCKLIKNYRGFKHYLSMFLKWTLLKLRKDKIKAING